MISFFETPLRKRIQELTSYIDLSKINKKKTSEVYGRDKDWIIGEDTDASIIPSKPDSNNDLSKPGSEEDKLWKLLDYIVRESKTGIMILSSFIRNKGQATEAIDSLLLETQ